MSHEGIGAFWPKVGESYTRGGGPAFPILDEGACVIYGGMTLRDYFAAKAMHGILAVSCAPGQMGILADDIPMIAKTCYVVADAMLKARQA